MISPVIRRHRAILLINEINNTVIHSNIIYASNIGKSWLSIEHWNHFVYPNWINNIFFKTIQMYIFILKIYNYKCVFLSKYWSIFILLLKYDGWAVLCTLIFILFYPLSIFYFISKMMVKIIGIQWWICIKKKYSCE